MKKRRFTCLAGLTLASAAIVAGVLLLGWFIFNLPTRAADLYGPASPRLDTFQHLYLAAQVLAQQPNLMQPLNPNGGDTSFEITLGEPTLQIANRLRNQGLIADAEAFRNYLRYAGLDTTLQAGAYTLSPRMTAVEIAQALQDATPTEVTFQILPGWRLEEIAASLETSGLEFGPRAFLAAASAVPSDHALAQEIPPGSSVEGFLLPGARRLPRRISADDFLRLHLDDFYAQVNTRLREGYSRQGLTLFQAVTLASIVEREAVDNAEMPLIASVFLNRISAGIKLDSDPTVQYARGLNVDAGTWWTNPLSLEDLQIDSPYNTYLYAGLPPGPIANPGLDALRAVAFPAQTPYFYFRAACDGTGKHVFSVTYEEHLGKACP